MRTLAIEFNDAGIAIADAQSVLAIEPGYAVVERDKIITGRDAVAKARLHPRQASRPFHHPGLPAGLRFDHPDPGQSPSRSRATLSA